MATNPMMSGVYEVGRFVTVVCAGGAAELATGPAAGVGGAGVEMIRVNSPVPADGAGVAGDTGDAWLANAPVANPSEETGDGLGLADEKRSSDRGSPFCNMRVNSLGG